MRYEQVDKTKIDGIKLVLNHMTDVLASKIGRDTKYTGNKPVREYNISVRTEKGQESFKYWGSIHEFEQGEYSDALDAFHCIVYDALTYININDIDQFAKELGYDKPSEAIEAWNSCKDKYKGLKRIGISEKRLHKLDNKLLVEEAKNA